MTPRSESDSTQQRFFFYWSIGFVLLFHVFSRPLSFLPATYQSHDQGCFVHYAARFVGEPYRHHYESFFKVGSRPGFLGLEDVPHCYPGQALFWIPGAMAAKGLSIVQGASFTEWLVAFIPWLTFLSLGLGYWAVFQIFSLQGASLYGLLAATAHTLSSPALLFSTAVPAYSHAAEFAFTALSLLALLRGQRVAAYLFAFLLVLTRPNGVFILLPLAGEFLDHWLKGRKTVVSRKPASKSMWFVAGLFILIAGWAGRLAIFGYGVDAMANERGTTLMMLVEMFELYHVKRFLWDSRQAVIYCAPWWLACSVLGVFYLRRLSWMSRAALAWSFLQAMICIAWQTNGGPGFPLQRYLTSVLVATILVWRELRPLLPSRLVTFCRSLLGVQVTVVFFFTWFYTFAPSENLAKWMWGEFAVPRVGEFIRGVRGFGLTPVVTTLLSLLPEAVARRFTGTPVLLSGPSLAVTVVSILVMSCLPVWAYLRIGQKSSFRLRRKTQRQISLPR